MHPVPLPTRPRLAPLVLVFLLCEAVTAADGTGSAVIDGAKSPGEWDSAARLDVFTWPYDGSSLYLMNDASHLYLALEVVGDGDLGIDDEVYLYFDEDADGAAGLGDDSFWFELVSGLRDSHRSDAYTHDVDSAEHGQGAVAREGTVNFFEFSKPLSSGDVEDFDLAVGGSVGFCLWAFPNGTGSANTSYPSACPYSEQSPYDVFEVLHPGGAFVVSTAADSGAGSLRRAIEGANATPGVDAIEFAIPEAECSPEGVCTIELASPLPKILEPLSVDGTTQTRYGSAPSQVCATEDAPSSMRAEVLARGVVEGHQWSDYVFDFDETGVAGASEVRGMALNGGNGIRFGTAGRHHAYCNHFGLDGTGTSVAGRGNLAGVVISSFAERVVVGTNGDGLDDLAERNVFGSNRYGVYVNSNDMNRIAGNYFGVSANGSASVYTGGDAVYIRQSSSYNVVGGNRDGVSDDLERNVMAGVGVKLLTSSGNRHNWVSANWIGVLPSGAPGPSPGVGVLVFEDDTTHFVVDNWITNQSTGIYVAGEAAFDPYSRGNCIMGNTIGLKHAGAAHLELEFNYWGAESGPAGEGPGDGDAIEVTGSGTVDAFPYEDACPLPEPRAAIGLLAGAGLLTALRRPRG